MTKNEKRFLELCDKYKEVYRLCNNSDVEVEYTQGYVVITYTEPHRSSNKYRLSSFEKMYSNLKARADKKLAEETDENVYPVLSIPYTKTTIIKGNGADVIIIKTALPTAFPKLEDSQGSLMKIEVASGYGEEYCSLMGIKEFEIINVGGTYLNNI